MLTTFNVIGILILLLFVVFVIIALYIYVDLIISINEDYKELEKLQEDYLDDFGGRHE